MHPAAITTHVFSNKIDLLQKAIFFGNMGVVRQEPVLAAFINSEPVERFQYRRDMREFGSFNNSMCDRVLDL